MSTQVKTRKSAKIGISQKELSMIRSLDRRVKKLSATLKGRKQVVLDLLKSGRKVEEGKLRAVIETSVKPMWGKKRIGTLLINVLGEEKAAETTELLSTKIEKKVYEYLQIINGEKS